MSEDINADWDADYDKLEEKLEKSEAGAAALRKALISCTVHGGECSLCDLFTDHEDECPLSTTAGVDMLKELEGLRAKDSKQSDAIWQRVVTERDALKAEVERLLSQAKAFDYWKERAEKAEKRIEHLVAIIQACISAGVSVERIEGGAAISNVRALTAEKERDEAYEAGLNACRKVLEEAKRAFGALKPEPKLETPSTSWKAESFRVATATKGEPLKFDPDEPEPKADEPCTCSCEPAMHGLNGCNHAWCKCKHSSK